ncbi:MAG: hypothetical protein OSB38_30405 [Paraburkholderia fungorum]|nr:hypothetical protein [Paraburkholderia fungorum]
MHDAKPEANNDGMNVSAQPMPAQRPGNVQATRTTRAALTAD